METRQSMFEEPSKGSKHTMYFPCHLRINNNISVKMKSSRKSGGRVCTCIHCTDVMYPLIWLNNDGVVIFFRHQHTGSEGGLDHVDDQVIGQDVQFLHLVPCHVGASSNAISSKERKEEF